MTRLLVTGGRKLRDWALVVAVLDGIQKNTPITLLLHGNHRSGADALAQQWADRRGIRTRRFDADWASFGKSAGPLRNQAMVDTTPDRIAAFPGGSGTEDCVRRAKRAGIPGARYCRLTDGIMTDMVHELPL